MGHALCLGDALFGLGSCFADEVGQQFRAHFYPFAANPMGTVYHPLAMAEQFQRLLENRRPTAEDIELVDDLYVHDFFHGDFSAATKELALQAMLDAHESARGDLERATAVVLTLGTAFGYRRLSTDKIVANCHKRPASEFARQLIYAQDLISELRATIETLRSHGKRVILTVSPVRHVRDSLIDNQISKAQLVTACHLLRQDYGDVEYFPAYEILLDELRDYRFYADDLAHPAPLACRIIFERFYRWAFAGKADDFFDEAESLHRRLAHRMLRPDSDSARRFLEERESKWRAFKSRYPFACRDEL